MNQTFAHIISTKIERIISIVWNCRLWRLRGFRTIHSTISSVVVRSLPPPTMHPPSTPPPPNTIPEKLFNDFTMNNQIPVLYSYKAEGGYRTIFSIVVETASSQVHNSAEDYKNAFERLEKRTFQYYDTDILSFYEAFEKYSFKGKTVLIWGLAGLNCEAMALWQGAEHVYVVDYNKPVCEHEQIIVMNHEELEKSGLKTDIAISFSSFEHDGLGRYGDPLNPNGDLEAMQTAKSFLKDNGLLLLGVPQGKDCLVWNLHRIYGEKRLPLLLQGWSVEDVFEQRSHIGKPLGAFTQPLMALIKTKESGKIL